MNEFRESHEMNDLNVEPDPDPEDEGETSFTGEPFGRLITEVNDLNTRVDESIEEVRSMQTESERALSDNLESLKELVQRQRAKEAGRKAKRLSEIAGLRKKVNRLTKRENIELEEIPDSEEREKIAETQRKLDRLTKQEIAEEKGDQETFINEQAEWDSFFNTGNFIEDNTEIEGPTVTVSEERTRRIKRHSNHKNAEDFFINILDLEPQCSNPEFVDYLTDSGVLTIRREFSGSSLVIDYNVKYLGGDFKSVGRTLTEEETNLLRDDIRQAYDSWTERERNKILKKAGIATAIGLSIIALATGLGVGLTRKGADMVHQAKKWEKLTPAKKVSKSIPWTELEKATGKVVIFTGEHIVIIITLVGIYLYSK